MPHDHDQYADYAKPVVTPYGQLGVTQSNVTIKPFTKLRQQFGKAADSSVVDFEDASLMPLKRRLRGQ